jgi:phage gp46-like protein
MYSGDPAIKISENGSTIVVKGGQPVMDEGLENIVNISLFTTPGWFGNIFASNDDEKIGSEFMAVASSSITKTSLLDTKNQAEQDLDWIIKNNIASKIEVDVTNPGSRNLQVQERIYKPSGELETLLQNRYGQNWISQLSDSAHGRI